MENVIPESESLADDMMDRPGVILKRTREAKGMSIADVAEVTRVAQRQLEAIERSDFASLPGTPYAVGFARAYARAVGADEVTIARGVREELGTIDAYDRYEAFEPVDPTRIPPRSLAWAAALIAILLAVGYGVWRTQFFSASTDQEIADLANRTQEAKTALPQQQAVQPVNNGPVVLTANQEVWLRIYDQAGERLFEKQLAKGESYTVPPDANNPMILTGRPDALAVTVGGRPVAPLGSPEKTISDVPVSAAALLARQLSAANDGGAAAAGVRGSSNSGAASASSTPSVAGDRPLPNSPEGASPTISPKTPSLSSSSEDAANGQ